MCTCVPTSSRRPSSTQFSQAGYAAGWLAGTAWPALLTGRVGSGSCSALTALRSAAAAAPSAPASANTTPGESSRVTVLSRCTSCTALVMPGVLPTCRGTGQGRAAWCSAGGVCAVGLQQRCRPAPVLTAPTAVQQQGPAPLLLPLLQPLLLPLLLPPPLPPSPLPPLLPALLGAHLCHAGALQRVDDTRLAHIGQAHHPHGDRGLDVSIAGIVLQQLQQGVCPQALGAAGAAVGRARGRQLAPPQVGRLRVEMPGAGEGRGQAYWSARAGSNCSFQCITASAPIASTTAAHRPHLPGPGPCPRPVASTARCIWQPLRPRRLPRPPASGCWT